MFSFITRYKKACGRIVAAALSMVILCSCTDANLELCKKLTLDSFEKSRQDVPVPIGPVFYYDIDVDGEDEIVVVSNMVIGQFFVYEKTPNGYENSAVFAYGKLDGARQEIKLYTYDYGGEKFPFYKFHYSNGTIMECDVIAAIVQDENGEYSIDYKLSWGVIHYPLIPPPLPGPIAFYRTEWYYGDLDLGHHRDYEISKEEFEETYKIYQSFM